MIQNCLVNTLHFLRKNSQAGMIWHKKKKTLSVKNWQNIGILLINQWKIGHWMKPSDDWDIYTIHHVGCI